MIRYYNTWIYHLIIAFMEHTKLIIIGGNIGAGKSEVIKLLGKKKGGVLTFPEDVDDWSYYLEKMYKNPGDYMGLFQDKVVTHFYNIHESILKEIEAKRPTEKNPLFVVVERSTLDCKKIFIKSNTRWFTELNLTALEDRCRYLSQFEPWNRATYCLINTPPETCLERTKLRARNGESALRLDYLKEIDRLHTTMFNEIILRKKRFDNIEKDDPSSIAEEIIAEEFVVVVN